MAKEESKLVEEVVETTETTKEEAGIKDEFNPLAFTDDAYGELGVDKTSENEDSEDEVKSEKEEAKEEKEQEEGWGWEKSEEEEAEKEEEEDDDWD